MIRFTRWALDGSGYTFTPIAPDAVDQTILDLLPTLSEDYPPVSLDEKPSSRLLRLAGYAHTVQATGPGIVALPVSIFVLNIVGQIVILGALFNTTISAEGPVTH